MTRPRRYLTFSLRTLFVVLTVLGIWLGVIANRAREQREAVRAIEKAGGFIAYYGKQGERLKWEKGNRDFEFHLFHTAARVGITSNRITDETCSQIARLPELKMVLLDGPVSDRGLSRLTNLQHVESVLLRRTEITNAGISQLQRMKSLEILDLGQTRLTDKNLEDLARLNKLFMLQASLKDVSNRGLNYFQRSLPHCVVKSTDH